MKYLFRETQRGGRYVILHPIVYRYYIDSRHFGSHIARNAVFFNDIACVLEIFIYHYFLAQITVHARKLNFSIDAAIARETNTTRILIPTAHITIRDR